MTGPLFRGVLPAFYACYTDEGDFSKERTQALAEYLIQKGVNGLYIGGSSGECIYRTVREREKEMEAVAEAVKGRIPVIAHIGAPSTKDSVELAQKAEDLGMSAISSIPPIYFLLSEDAIESYWGAMIKASKLPFIIYNIPGTTKYSLSERLFKKMLAYPTVKGLKNSSMPVQDIERFRRLSGEGFTIFNGPDEQFAAGRMMGADAGIGGTYCAMPELFLAADRAISRGDTALALRIQHKINDIIFLTFTCKGSLYSVYKEILKRRGCPVGQARLPLPPVSVDDEAVIEKLMAMMDQGIREFQGPEPFSV